MSDELDEARAALAAMPYGPAKVATLEHAIRVADARNDVESGYRFREQLIGAVGYTREPEKALVAFAWNLARFDREPERFDERSILWKYKSTIKWMVGFPGVQLAQVEEALADLGRRFARYGASPRAIHSLRGWTAAWMGRPDLAAAALPAWKKAPRDAMNDCLACETDDLMEVNLFIGREKQALKIAEPILNRSLRCGNVPQCTFGTVLRPLVRAGRWDEATRYHEAGYPMVRGDASQVTPLSDHLVFKAMAGDPTQAIRPFESLVGLLTPTTAPMRRYEAYRASAFLFRRLTEAGKKTRKLKLPEAFPLHNAKKSYDVGELAGWFEREARALANQLDARAGSRYRNDELDGLADLLALAR